MFRFRPAPRYGKTASGLPGPDAVSRKRRVNQSDRSAVRFCFSRLQTIQPWRKSPPAPPKRIRGVVRVSFHSAITLHPVPANVNRDSRLFSSFFGFFFDSVGETRETGYLTLRTNCNDRINVKLTRNIHFAGLKKSGFRAIFLRSKIKQEIITRHPKRKTPTR